MVIFCRYLLTGLSENTTYHLNLTATNNKGEGPPQTLTVTTYANSQGMKINVDFF